MTLIEILIKIGDFLFILIFVKAAYQMSPLPSKVSALFEKFKLRFHID
jgi:hypothetical protein